MAVHPAHVRQAVEQVYRLLDLIDETEDPKVVAPVRDALTRQVFTAPSGALPLQLLALSARSEALMKGLPPNGQSVLMDLNAIMNKAPHLDEQGLLRELKWFSKRIRDNQERAEKGEVRPLLPRRPQLEVV